MTALAPPFQLSSAKRLILKHFTIDMSQMKQISGTTHRPVIKGKTKISIHQDDKGRDQDDKNEHENRHSFLEIHSSPCQESPEN